MSKTLLFELSEKTATTVVSHVDNTVFDVGLNL